MDPDKLMKLYLPENYYRFMSWSGILLHPGIWLLMTVASFYYFIILNNINLNAEREKLIKAEVFWSFSSANKFAIFKIHTCAMYKKPVIPKGI